MSLVADPLTILTDISGQQTQLDKRLGNLERTAEGFTFGMILMWYGAADDVPDGWAICDGANGTPDLRGRLPVGFKATDTDFDTLGETGGSKTASIGAHHHTDDHGHSGGSHHHSESDHAHGLNSHVHGIDHDHPAFLSGTPTGTTAADPIAGAAASTGHTHQVDVPALSGVNSGAASGNTATAGSGTNTGDASVTIVTTTGLTTGDSGATSVSIIPPFLTLHFIMRIR